MLFGIHKVVENLLLWYILLQNLDVKEAGFDNPTILVVTDRIDLDNQISSTFRRTGFSNPIQAVSISNLKELLKDSYGKTLITTIHKFQERAQEQKRDRNTK